MQIVRINCFIVNKLTTASVIQLSGLSSSLQSHIIMVIVACPLQGCSFVTDDLDASIVAVLLQIHASSHSSENVNSMKGPKLDRPRIDVGADQEVWNSFLRRWENFRMGSNIRDCIAPVQLLQCAGEELSEMLLKTEPRIASLLIDKVL